MAKDASDREDLLREATGFTRRIELKIPNVEPVIFCGFRDNRAFSLYWGQGTVFQFNPQRELRRGYWNDRMVASYKRQLHWLDDAQGTGRVQLKRVAMSDSESEAYLEALDVHRRELEAALRQDAHVVVGKVPSDESVETEVLAWLDELQTVQLALHPGVGRAK